MTRKHKKPSIMHYISNQKILLVGEGDFSFAVSLATAFGDASNIVATSLDSERKAIEKYNAAKENMEILKEKGCVILHGINAHTMSHNVILQDQVFDRIIFNFPQAVNVWVHREYEQSQIKRNQKLVSGFLENAYKLLSNKGQIHITHKRCGPYGNWNITGLAEEAGLKLVNEVEFDKYDYPGYCNKKGDAHRKCDQTFPVGACSTYMFGVA